MQIETLRYFLELARVGSFYGAAKNVFISQQGLNKAISSLESELGVKLVVREKRGVRLTAAGEVFQEHAQRLVVGYSDMLKDLYTQHAISGASNAQLVIHLTYYPSQLSDAFVRKMKSNTSISLREEPFPQIVEGALNSEGDELYLCDFYGGHERLDEIPNLVFEPIIATRAGVIWTDTSPLETPGSIHRERLADVPISIDSHREMLKLAEYVMDGYPLNNIRMGVANPKGRIEYTSVAEDIRLLYDSLGYTLIQANPQLASDSLHFTPFSTPRSVVQIGFLYNKQARPNVRARNLIEVLRNHLTANFADYYRDYPLP